MIEELLEIYDKAGAPSKPWQTRGFQSWFIIIWIVCFSGYLLFVIRSNAAIKPDSWRFVLLPLVPFIVFLILLVVFVRTEIPSNPPHKTIRDIRMKKITRHIIENDWNETILDMVQSAIRTKAEKSNRSIIFFASAFSLLFVPLWSAYLDKVFEYFKASWYILNLLFVALLVLVIAIAMVLTSSKLSANGLITKFGTLERLNELITEIRISGLIHKTVNSDNEHS